MASASASPQITLTAHLRILRARLAGRTNESPEALLADLIPDLISSLAPHAGRGGIDLLGQPYEAEIGRPDFSVKDGPLLVGHVETKAPGAGADVEAFRTRHDRDQWERFRNLPNLVYTDGTAFALYRSGVREGEVVRVSGGGGPLDEASPDAVARLVALLGAFLSWRAVPPGNLTSLADHLAPLCAVLRDAVRVQLSDRHSEVAKAAAEFETALFPGRTPAEIADAFAQVCTYSMLLARAAGADTLDPLSVEQSLRHGHPVLGRLVRVLLDEQTQRELGWALETLRTLIEVIDFEKLRRARPLPGMTHHDQTWLYFYEAFLARYDPDLRDQYGVYYTPQQVIHAQVALVEDLLRARLGLALGMASPEVTVLDPAVGTGSYPIRVVLAAADGARQAFGEAAVAETVRGLAANLHAFEILAGPYAVAHLRLSEILESLDAGVPGEAVGVYLTDTLSSPYAEPGQLTRLLEPLVEEQRRALRVKSGVSVLVCLGNPPYERGRRLEQEGEAGGGWVVLGDGGGARPIFEDFLEPVRAAGFGGHAKNLYNDYVYFWRWALWKTFERADGGGFSDDPGVVSFITASSYLSGHAFVGMREHLRRTCDELWILDLGGEGRGARREENVFAIQTPVAIALAVRTGASQADQPATVRYARIEGDRSEKLARLASLVSLDDLEWQDCASGWQEPFLPASSGGWAAMAPV
ncbi:MAG: N-6 DNA methylase, partial [Solirubrobacteraceae bacterium]